ncbi:MAG TPA: exodeoxyribonuclease V subunit beta [Rhodocyclaceae bacterium]|nr:exodeoxyribonuclease V subunit beta [Rhodocyclaceae bacterium]
MSGSELLDPLTLPLHGSRLIEASAGTGKTFTIAALYLRLVLNHGGDQAFGQELLPPDILVVTFTDAATKELRDRIRLRLTEAARHFRGSLEKPDPYLQRLRAGYPEADWPRCARRLEIAAEWMDEAAVSTIHAWCNRMLREHAFDSGSLFAQNLEADHSELLLEVVRDYWRIHCYPLAGDGLEWVLERWQDPRTLVRRLVLDPTEAEEGALPPLGEVFDTVHRQRLELLARLKAPWPDWADQIQSLLDDAVAAKVVDGRKIQARHYGPWLADLKAWAQDPARDALDLRTGWTRLTPAGIAEAWKDGTPPEHPAFAEIATLQAALAALPRPDRDMLRHASAWVRTRFEQEKARRAELGFDDLLIRLDGALRGRKGPQLAECIRRQFPVAMIDEFQDTDPVQYAIFSQVYNLADGARDTGLFMIGDPKQAIYAFRNADIYTYLAARRATEGRHYTLGTNFRSTGGMVEAVNQFFHQAETRAAGRGAFLFRELEANPVPFLPVAAQGRRDRFVVRGEAGPALTLWHPDGQTEPFSKDDYRQQLAASCASEIARLLNLGQAREAGFAEEGKPFHPLRPGDLAVLVRSYAQAKAVREELARREVRTVYLSDKDSVLKTPEAHDLRLWLRAAAEPDEDRLLRAALGTRTLDLPLESLEHLNQDELAWEARVLQFRGYRSLWRQQGVLPMLRRLIHDFDLPQRLAQTTAGERTLTNLLHLSELLQQGASELDGEQALIRFLSEQISEESAAEERILRLESDENLVKVITIHKSKGLEYPLVFIPFACHYRPIRGDDAVVKYHEADGSRVTVLAPEEEQVQRADFERLAEDLRLLYVALTRARHACWVGVADVKTGRPNQSDLHRTAFGYLLTGGEPLASSSALAESLAALRGECGHIAIEPLPEADGACFQAQAGGAPALAARTVVRRAASEPWWIASYSALRIGGEAPEEAVEIPEAEPAVLQYELELLAPETALAQKLSEADAQAEGEESLPTDRTAAQIHRFPKGAGPGTFLHGLLEWAAREGFAQLVANPARLSDAIARRCNRRSWEAWIAPLDAWLRQLLDTPLPLGEGRATLRQLESYQPEMEFWFETCAVDTQRLDALVCAHTLAGAPRPRLEKILLHGMLKGYIDLVFEHGGRYYVADYKSNWLGHGDADYTPEAMAAAILEKRYDLQYALYLLALHRQLQARLPDYDYDRHIGGAAYIFLRGSRAASRGIHFERPPRALIEAMDALFRGAADGGAP